MALVELLELTTKLHCSKEQVKLLVLLGAAYADYTYMAWGSVNDFHVAYQETPLFGGVSFTINPIVLERRLDVPNETHQGTGEPTPVHV